MENQYTVADINCLDNTVIYRDMTEEEIVNLKKANDDFLANEAIKQAKIDALDALKASAKAKLIAGEPLTAEEASVIVL